MDTLQKVGKRTFGSSGLYKASCVLQTPPHKNKKKEVPDQGLFCKVQDWQQDTPKKKYILHLSLTNLGKT